MYCLLWSRPDLLDFKENAYLMPDWRNSTKAFGPWGSLSEAVSYSSEDDCKKIYNTCPHWKSLTEIVFIHPLNKQ